jgi:sugar porter (SP) family MFS transporter
MKTHDSEYNSKYVWTVSLVAALGGLLFGYDTGVISGTIGLLEARFLLNPSMVGWVASCALIGCIFGAAFAGPLNDFLGRRKVLLISAVLFLVSALGTALPKDLTQFIIFRFLGGIGVGAASMTSPLYIAEVTPTPIRGRMVSINQFAIVSGFIVVYFVNYLIALGRDETWLILTGWRLMFGSEALPAMLLLLLLLFVPESPRWLFKQGREKQSFNILSRINRTDIAERELREIKEIVSQESGSIMQLLQPGLRIALILGIALAILQQITGINVVLYYAPEIFKNLGYGTESALLQTVIVGAVNVSFTIVAIWTVDFVGRKPLMIIGASGMGVALCVIGLLFFFKQGSIIVVIFVLIFIASFAMSMGPVVWIILSEIFHTRIRGRAMSIATVTLWISCYIISQTFPMMDKNAWLVQNFNHGFSFWVYSFFCFVTVLFVIKFLPETKGKSLEEIEAHWLKRDIS